MNAPLKGIIFDLDGTLLDTLQDIAAAANRACLDLGVATHTDDEYRLWIGDGVRMLMTRALGEGASENLIDRAADRMRFHYDLALSERTRPYPGIPDLLTVLSARGVPRAVLSNKPHEFTVRLIADLFPEVGFSPVLGAKPSVPRKPDPGQALGIIQTFGLAAAEVAYVGDTPVDMETARRAGMVPIGVAWGFRPEAELVAAGAAVVVTRPDELLAYLARPDSA